MRLDSPIEAHCLTNKAAKGKNPSLSLSMEALGADPLPRRGRLVTPFLEHRLIRLQVLVDDGFSAHFVLRRIHGIDLQLANLAARGFARALPLLRLAKWACERRVPERPNDRARDLISSLATVSPALGCLRCVV